MDIANKRVLITGGSSGIGLALARALGKLGARVLLAARQEEGLRTAKSLLAGEGVDVATVAADVTRTRGRAVMLEVARLKLGGIDILINSAGAVRGGRLDAIEVDEILTMVDVNLLSPILLTREVLPHLRDSGDALVVNISSGMGLVGMPFYSVYAAVKAGIGKFGDALRRELDGEGIRVLNVFPVATDTPMMSTSAASVPLEDASDVADAVCRAIASDELQVVRGGDARAQMITLDRSDPAALDKVFLARKPEMERAVANHRAL
ncbi:SDR family NAD(P)-dependent oxidoreductase [Cupriavidus sp. CV2]|uniref:SDR family NAD(P)-dependent oxidoreductase n=1 Tax=Cupriavidus ulmosensis TaxID=3065913 RepID=UPI00296A944F|nr:SDR family NAD(P)-dependent oxidoreductase [Cupriavidus sp. CV2]MDW3683748.1 SDR family NAD(P)-dependent oxidoreductase [Cupriavidus sp. CV2]